MYCKEYTFEDYDGNNVTEKYWFHLSEMELLDMHNSKEGGLDGLIEKIQKEQDAVKMQEFFKELMNKSYGVRIDNVRFSKKPEYLEAFQESPAYSDLFFLFASDEKEATAFINGIMPKKLRDKAAELQKAGTIPASTTPIN